MLADRRITTDAVVAKLGISRESVHSILQYDLNMHQVCLHILPKMLSSKQKEMKADMYRDLIDIIVEDDSFLKDIVTGDET